MVDYKPQQSLFVGSTDTAIKDAAPSRQVQTKPETSLDLALQQQSHLSTPSWQQSSTADEKSKQPNTPSMIGALGEISGLTRLIEYFISNGQAVG